MTPPRSASVAADPDPAAAETSSRRPWIMRAGGLIISLVALAIVFGTVDVAATWTVASEADPLLLLAALGMVAAQIVVRGWRWRVVLPHRPDGSPVPIRRTISPLLVGYLGNAVLPARLGEPIRAALVARREQLDALESFGATMLERLIDVVTLALIGFGAAVALQAEWWIIVAAGTVGIGGLIAFAVLVVVGTTRVVDFGSAVLSRVGLGDRTQRLQGWVRTFAGGVDRGRDLPRLGLAIGISLIAWVLDALIFFLVALALGIDITFPAAVLIGAVAVLATAIPAAPGYVGTFELAATATAVALGVPRPEALALAVGVHLITVVPVALAGGVAVIATGSRLGQLAEAAEKVEHEPA